MGEAPVVALEVAGVERHGRGPYRTGGGRVRLADGQRPVGERAPVGRQVVSQHQRPGAARVLSVEPGETVVELGGHVHPRNDRERVDRQRRFVVERQVQDRKGRRADVGEEPVVVALRRHKVQLQVGHVGVGQADRHVEIGDPGVARDGDRRAYRAGTVRNRLRHVDRRIGRAARALRHGREHGGAQLIVAGIDVGRLDQDGVGPGRGDGDRQRFRVGGRGAGIVHDERRAGEGSETEQAGEVASAPVRLQIETQEERVPRLERDVEEVRVGLLHRPGDPAAGGERLRHEVVGLRLGLRRAAPLLEVEPVGTDLVGRHRILDPQVVGAGRGNRRSRDRRGGRAEGAVVAVGLDHRRAVARQQVEHAVEGLVRRVAGDDGGVNPVPRRGAEGPDVHVGVGIDVPLPHRAGGERRRRRRAPVGLDLGRVGGTREEQAGHAGES